MLCVALLITATDLLDIKQRLRSRLPNVVIAVPAPMFAVDVLNLLDVNSFASSIHEPDIDKRTLRELKYRCAPCDSWGATLKDARGHLIQLRIMQPFQRIICYRDQAEHSLSLRLRRDMKSGLYRAKAIPYPGDCMTGDGPDTSSGRGV